MKVTVELDDYDFSQGVRGKYVERFARGSNVVVLSPDIAEIFPDSESVNKALRMLVEIAGRSTGTPTTAGALSEDSTVSAP
jgi:hypothetical protein